MHKFNNTDYKALIPQKLHKEVESLLAYLEFFPFENPTSCPNCASTSFHRTGTQQRPDLTLHRHLCNHCGKSFTQLSNTIFNRTYDLKKWIEVGKLYFTGRTRKEIAQTLNMTYRTIAFRCDAIDRYMQQNYPKLYDGWRKHQERKDLTFTKTVQQQTTVFLAWLHERINKKDYACPKCHKPMLKFSKTDLRPFFVCNGCRIYYNALEGTRLKGLPQIHFWLPYVQQLIEGYGCNDINRLIKLGKGAAQSWRPIFIAQMLDLGLDELVQWIEWQRKRRRAQVLKINKWITNFDNSAKLTQSDG